VVEVPRATYRLQLNREFGFREAAALAPYLQNLGVSHVYASPVLAARGGSTHGYDVVDPLRLNPELGGQADFDVLVEALSLHGLGLILDIVPNHMAAHPENPWWRDVLESGPLSPYAGTFDIDWEPEPASLRNRVLLPTLGDAFGTVLESGQLRVGIDEDGLAVWYYENRFPLDPVSYNLVLEPARDWIKAHAGAAEMPRREIERLISNVRGLAATGHSPQGKRTAAHERRELKDWLWRVHQDFPELRQALKAAFDGINGRPDEPGSFDRLEALLERQHYRLAYWRLASEMINYRRFFDIGDLVSVRIDDPDVLQATHKLIFELAATGKVDGFRADHVDGLHDPAGYLEQFQETVSGGDSERRSYFLVEKILIGDERLPDDWPVNGTTGYEFADRVNNVLVAPEGFERIREAYCELTGLDPSFEDTVYVKKLQMLDDLFAGEFTRLAADLARLAERGRHARDVSPRDLAAALRHVTACFPIYRSYVRDWSVSDRDRHYVAAALEDAQARAPRLNHAALAFLRRVLLLEVNSVSDSDGRAGSTDSLTWVQRWQQLTGPLMAKGLEDTALYVYTPLLSLNEVGGEPEPITVDAFHAHNQYVAEHWPHTMLTTSTHDTKRSEDVRARLAVLSELPDEWLEHLDRWMGLNEAARTEVDGRTAPDANEEQFIYQTLLGAWPLDDAEMPAFRERVKEYLTKAMREAKAHSSWIDVNEPYEAAVHQFVDRILDADAGAEFLRDFRAFQWRIAGHGVWNSLSQLVLKLTSPGVPDIYRGTELWDFSLADPDNRRPVDFEHRERELSGVREASARDLPEMVRRWQDGRIKLYCLERVLALRSELSNVYRDGDYLPVSVTELHADRVIAYARPYEERWVLTIVPRLVAALSAPGEPPVGESAWGDTALVLPDDAPRVWTDAISGQRHQSERSGDATHLRISDIFSTVPVAVLHAVE
jgi:(1->4)-alpha-D-glucan 1-alpha-D-glucosylmutase